MVLSRVFALIPIIWSIYLFAAACNVGVPGLMLIGPEEFVGVAFVVTTAISMPFVFTYTTLGLNSAEGEAASKATTERRSQLYQACPILRVAWYVVLGGVSVIWAGGALWGFPIHPLLALYAAFSLMSGVWFLIAYPVAMSLFSNDGIGDRCQQPPQRSLRQTDLCFIEMRRWHMVLSRVFALIPIIWSIYLFAAACNVGVPGLMLIDPEQVVGVAFVVTTAIGMPFVFTYTTLGLNSAEGEAASKATTERRSQLYQACPIWRVAWYVVLVGVSVIWAGGEIWGFPIHPLLALCAAISLLSGVWFLIAYPVALSLFSND